ncbi:MAG: LuxR family transcriptional regulator, maltose regulon positive regulatory protein, partial [Solirubrobacteraceae bacterium]|nr:LuxR family transcriptional regulator, maltose regulon positive regulatory protein [Solirubrobacteraceae bacterium]
MLGWNPAAEPVTRPATAHTAPAPHAPGRRTGARLRAASAVTPVRTRPQPPFRPGLVARGRLVERLADARDVPLALVVAPAGYGKTTALSEWAEQDARPFAWIALDHDDNDAARLLASIAIALDEIEPVGRDIFAAVSVRDPLAPEVVARRLGEAIAGRRRPFVLVLD